MSPLPLCSLIFGLVAGAAPQVDAQQAEADAPLPVALEGFDVKLWATSPLLQNPTAIDIDERGRVWVTEGVRYRRWGGRNPGLEREGDRIVIVSDEDGDGVAETSKVFVEDPDLVSPLGILILDDVVLVSNSPHLFAYYDDDGDDVADRREILLTGFGGFNHDHGLHSAVFGPDGSLYLSMGNAGPHVVTGSDGTQLASGSIYTGGGPSRADNKPGLVSSDGRAWTGGLVVRVERDGSGLAVQGHNFRNQYEVAVDPYGRMWTSDNDDDGNRGVQVRWVVPGGNHGYFSTDGKRTWQADRRPGQLTQRAHWHADNPGVAPLGTIYGAGSPTGVTFLSGGPLHTELGESLITCDAGRGIVFAWEVEHEGSGWQLKERRLLESNPSDDVKSAWFRPSDAALAPDGSLIVADWFDPAVGGHYAGDHRSIGHLYRVTGPKTTPIVPTNLDSPLRAIAALNSPIASVRSRALARLERDRKAVTPMLQSIATQGTSSERAHALWFLGRKSELPLVQAIQTSKDARVREVALTVLARYHGERLPALAGEHLWGLSPHAEVRSAVARSLEGLSVGLYSELWGNLFDSHVVGDRAGIEALGQGARGQEEELWFDLILRDGTPPSEWSPRFEEIVWRLHPEAATEAWQVRALEARLDTEQRRHALDALAFTPGRAAAEAMMSACLAGPEDLRSYARWWIEHRDTNDWREWALREELQGGSANVANAEELWRSEAVESGVVPVDVLLDGVEVLWLVVDAAGSNGHDWADWIDPRIEVDGTLVSLCSIPWESAETGWGGVNIDRNAGNSAPLAIGGQELRGIGTHAPSAISWKLPANATRFLASVGIDDGGSKQSGAHPRVHFEVRAQHSKRATHLGDVAIAFGEQRTDAERSTAIEALALHPQGALVLIQRASAGTLGSVAHATASAHIFSNPEPSVRALASEHFQRPGNAENSLPSIPELLELSGDVNRGRELFLSKRALCTSCHAFELHGMRRGKDLGPELTAIGQKYGRDGLFDAILNPSAGIAFGYDVWMVEAGEGNLLTGFLLADGDPVIIKDTQGERHAIPADEITYMEKQSLSTMPQGVAAGLSAQELADLVAFLKTPEPEPEFGEWQSLWNGVDLDGWVPYLSDPDADPADVWQVVDGTLICRGNPAGYIRTEARHTNFQLELQWRFDPVQGAGNSGVLLRLHNNDKIWPNSIEAQLQSRNAGDIWNIGDFPLLTDPTRTNGRHTARSAPSSELPLGEWNTYLITMNHGALTLEVNGVVQNTAAWCAEIPGTLGLQSEGAEIHFRNVRLRPIR